MSKGYFAYYDKEREENIPFKGAFSFLTLDELITVTGFNEPSQSGIYSNEVHKLDDTLNVSIFGARNPFASGKWKDIKREVAYEGGKFAFSVYGMQKIGESWELVNIKIAGGALGPWIELKSHNDVFGSNAVVQRTHTKEKKGSNEFLSPVFELKAIEDRAILDAADELDKILQEYLDGRGLEKSETAGSDFSKEPDNDFEQANAEVACAGPSEEDDDIPF